MRVEEFKLERYFAKYEFNVRHLLSASDCESFSMNELLEMADSRSLHSWHNLSLGYTESAGHPELREEAAKLYPSVSSDGILAAAPEEGIFIALNAVLQKGDHVIAVSPAYQSLHAIPDSLGCSVTGWELKLKDGSWYLDPDFLEKAVRPETKLIIINFPHNPTGYIPSQTDFNRMIELARSRGIYIFSDEMYRYMEFNKAIRLPPIASCYEKGISLFGLSKTFGLPGLRIGWLATRERELYSKFALYKDYTTICSSAPSEILAIMALRKKEKIIARNMDIIRKNISLVKAFFSKYPELFYWIPPLGGSISFPGLNPKIPVEKLCREIVAKKNVMIVPGTVFDYPGNHFRVGLGRNNLAEALQPVDDYLEESGI